jgi:hypothetical protein
VKRKKLQRAYGANVWHYARQPTAFAAREIQSRLAASAICQKKHFYSQNYIHPENHHTPTVSDSVKIGLYGI